MPAIVNGLKIGITKVYPQGDLRTAKKCDRKLCISFTLLEQLVMLTVSVLSFCNLSFTLYLLTVCKNLL